MFKDEVDRKTENAVAAGIPIPSFQSMIEIMAPRWRQQF
jgi:hypothetical protein